MTLNVSATLQHLQHVHHHVCEKDRGPKCIYLTVKQSNNILVFEFLKEVRKIFS